MVDPGHVSLQDVVDLRWRDETLSVREIHDKITRVLYLLDRNSEISVQLAETTAKNVVERCRLEGSSVWIWARKRKFIVRTGRTPGTRQWLAEFVHVGHEIIRVLDSQQPSKCRHFQYVTGGPSRRSKEHVKQMVMNWAVTLEVHPFCLGIVLESTGTVFTPEGFKIECTQKRNMMTRVETHWVIQPGREPIPYNIVDLKVTNGKNIEAIVVTEHRNLNTDLPSFITNNKNVIVVMTGGYSCLATREFLRLLGDSRALKNTPFLWISDHDPHAFQVYTSLKYGSKAMAWLSPSTCVNKLEFFGPTESHFDQLVDQEIAARKLEIKARQPRLTAAEVDTRATEQMRDIRDKFSKICRQKLNKNDLTILKNVKKSSHQDHWLKMEVNSMLQTQRGKFGMHEIDNVAKGTSLAFVLQAAKSFTSAPVPTNLRGKVSHPLRVRTAQLASRVALDGDLTLSSPAKRNAMIESQTTANSAWVAQRSGTQTLLNTGVLLPNSLPPV